MIQSNRKKNKSRHCMVVHAYYPIGETRVEREAHALVDQGYDVDVICLKQPGDPSSEEINGVGIFRLPVSRHKKSGRFIQLLEYLAFFLLASFKLTRLYIKERYVCVQVHNLPDFLVFCALIPKLFGSRVILDIHDLMPEFYAASIDSDLNSFPVRLIVWEEQISCRFADHVICVTENARQALISRNLPADKISIVMNVADSKVFHRLSESEITVENNGKFRLVYHGAMVKRYGVDLLVKAVARLRQQIPEVELNLIGRGEFRDELIALIKTLEVENQISFPPNLLHAADLPGILRKCDVGVVPNLDDLFTDGLLPTKLMEYTALGIPVIAAKTTTISDYFDDSMVLFFQPGNLDDLCDKILILFQNPNLRNDLIENSNQFNQRYSWKNVAADYIALIDRLNQQ